MDGRIDDDDDYEWGAFVAPHSLPIIDQRKITSFTSETSKDSF